MFLWFITILHSCYLDMLTRHPLLINHYEPTLKPCRILYKHEGPSPSPTPQCKIWRLFYVFLYYFSTLRLLMLTENSAAPCHARFSLRNSMRKRRTGASEACGSTVSGLSGQWHDPHSCEVVRWCADRLWLEFLWFLQHLVVFVGNIRAGTGFG